MVVPSAAVRVVVVLTVAVRVVGCGRAASVVPLEKQQAFAPPRSWRLLPCVLGALCTVGSSRFSSELGAPGNGVYVRFPACLATLPAPAVSRRSRNLLRGTLTGRRLGFPVLPQVVILSLTVPLWEKGREAPDEGFEPRTQRTKMRDIHPRRQTRHPNRIFRRDSASSTRGEVQRLTQSTLTKG